MGNSVIELGSLTISLKVKKILKRSGINSEVIRVGRGGDNGCSYGIRFRSQFLYDAIHLLKMAGIKYSLYNGP